MDRAESEPELAIYHLSAHGHTSRFDFALRILEMTAARFPLPAARPLNVATSKDKIERVFGVRVAPWETLLRTFLHELVASTATGSA